MDIWVKLITLNIVMKEGTKETEKYSITHSSFLKDHESNLIHL